MSLKIGIDVGGTFTDLFVWSSDNKVFTVKTLSTPEDPSIAVVEGIRAIAADQGRPLSELMHDITTIVHGTTVTTNATLTRTGAKTALITTHGVRDALEMRRGIREEQYNNRFTNVPPLVPRMLRRPVRGRIDGGGQRVEPLSLDDIHAACARFRQEGVAAVAVCFMNAFLDPTDENAAASIVQRELPHAFLSVSSTVLPTIRFYDRVSTTAMNAYVGPILSRYIKSLEERLKENGFRGVLLIMQSSGGVALPAAVMSKPASTLLSGPAAGPCAGAAFVRPHGTEDCVVIDMGGTSFDASLVRGGEALTRSLGEIERLRVALPMLDIVTIGAGGGSIGWVDSGGLLRMGPKSAGAQPGPACYGRGGTQPTCTDANVVLGYLDPKYFAGGKLHLDTEAARRAIASYLATPLGMSVEEAAAGMFRVINTNMAHGVREITVKRGVDPREFPLVVAGGAAALHACAIALELEIPRLVVPGVASVLCAAGMLLSDLQHDFVRSLVAPLSTLDFASLLAVIEHMRQEGESALALEGVEPARREFGVSLDLRYMKQYHEVTVRVSLDALKTRNLAEIQERFHAEHNRLYGYDLRTEGTDLELIHVRLRAVGRVPKPTFERIASGDRSPAHAKKSDRRAFVPESNRFVTLPVYDGASLLANNTIVGPALIERSDTCIVVTESFGATIDPYGSAILTTKESLS